MEEKRKARDAEIERKKAEKERKAEEARKKREEAAKNKLKQKEVNFQLFIFLNDTELLRLHQN